MKNMNKIEEKIIGINALDSRIKELEQNLALLEKQIAELQSCQLALDELKNIKKETEMFSSISPGVFVKSKLLDNSHVIIDVGAKVFCKKNINDAKEIIQPKLNSALEIYNKMIQEINILAQNIISLEKDIKDIREQEGK